MVEDNKYIEKIKDEAKKLKADTLYTYKGHYNSADCYHTLNFIVNISIVILSVLSFFLAKTIIDKGIAGIICILSFTILLIKFEEKISQHLKSAKKYHNFHNDVRIFIEIDCLESTKKSEIRGKLESFVERKNILDSDAPVIRRWAYKKTKEGIENGEASYEEELDNGK